MLQYFCASRLHHLSNGKYKGSGLSPPGPVGLDGVIASLSAQACSYTHAPLGVSLLPTASFQLCSLRQPQHHLASLSGPLTTAPS
jgi:hypothetical protein